jgi:putative peptide zinc metalloprotease protein
VGDGPLARGQQGGAVTQWPNGKPRPTKGEPALAMVLVPRGEDGTTTQPGQGDTGTGGADGQPATWVFPFDRPLPPGEGDQQTLAVNTNDDTVVYDLAFAMVWVDGDADEPVDTANEAYALASCDNCAAVAVSFQVVLVVGDADVVIPRNVAVAVNYDCVQCLTYALATQLVVTLDGPLSEEGMARLSEIWQELAGFASTITDRSLDEIQATLQDYQDQILEVVQSDPATTEATTEETEDGSEEPTGTTEEPAPSDAPSEGTSEGTTEEPATTEAPEPTPAETAEPSPEPTATTSP